MNQLSTFLTIIVIALGCKSQPEPFEYTIRGTVIDLDSGEFYLSESPRAGDAITIPFKNHKFEYTGSTPNMFNSGINFNNDDPGGLYSIVVEPGEIILELYSNSSKVIAGYYNLSFQKDQKELNYGEIIEVYMIENSEDFLPVDKIGEVLNGIEDKEVKKSREYIKLHSIWQSKKDSINMVGKKAMDFELLNVDKEAVSFQSVARNKITYVEKSGSWCGNSTRLSRELKPIYEKYKDKGFEIITIVPELKLDRWEKWLEKEKFPWTNLVELEDDIANSGISKADMLFRGYGIANYLVDVNGEVIATDISSAALNEMLMQEFEPVAYKEYLKNKWTLPEGFHILDREVAINSFDELVQQMSGKPFFIDRWATWCSPCIEEFSHSEDLEEFLKSKDMELVYINSDRTIDEMTWLNNIRKYNLKGHHLRANSTFDNDLYESGLSSGALPQYIIVDAAGEVVVKDAFRPSEKEKLYHQIENAIVKKSALTMANMKSRFEPARDAMLSRPQRHPWGV
jgi:thiol-disulfide isomerase/thioredoxin